jgi:MFS family permease
MPALLGCRALNGIGFGGMMSMGTPMLNDMFFMHERGEKTGIYTVFVTNGAHIAVLSELPSYLDSSLSRC